MRENLSLHFGPFSNHVASHYWNLLEAEALDSSNDQTPSDAGSQTLDRSPLYLSSNTARGRRNQQMPRAIFFDLSENIGFHASQKNAVSRLISSQSRSRQEGASRQNLFWNGGQVDTIVQHNEIPPFVQAVERRKNLLRDGEPSQSSTSATSNFSALPEPQSWTEFNNLPLKKETNLCAIHGGNHSHPFQNYGEGRWSDGIASREEKERTEELIRQVLEEADHLQAIQSFVDVNSGWGGFATDTLELLRDECRSATQLVVGFHPQVHIEGQLEGSPSGSAATPGKKALLRQSVNAALSTNAIVRLADVYIPVLAQDQTLRARWNDFEYAGLLAAAFDTATLPIYSTSSSGLETVAAWSQRLLVKPQMNLLTLSTSGLRQGQEWAQQVISDQSGRGSFRKGLSSLSIPSSDVSSSLSTEFGSGVLSALSVARGIPERNQWERAIAQDYRLSSPNLHLLSPQAFSQPIALPASFPDISTAVATGRGDDAVSSREAGLYTAVECRVETSDMLEKLSDSINHRSLLTISHEYQQFGISAEEFSSAHEDLLSVRDYYKSFLSAYTEEE